MAELLQQQSVRGVFWWCRFDWSVKRFSCECLGIGRHDRQLDGAGAGAATAPVGRAEGHAVGWHAARRPTDATQLSAMCERRDRRQDGPNAPGGAAREERAATRRGGGEEVFGARPPRRSAPPARKGGPRGGASRAGGFAGAGPFLAFAARRG